MLRKELELVRFVFGIEWLLINERNSRGRAKIKELDIKGMGLLVIV